MSQAVLDAIWTSLQQVKDPEIPVINVVDMGIVRSVTLHPDSVHVTITPTYSGCPAMHVIEQEIAETLQREGYPRIDVETVLAPAWTTDWMTDSAKEQLRAYGIAPPKKTCAATRSPLHDPGLDTPCPYCGSDQTELRSSFGSTACKALHFCRGCTQPFESFKCI